MRYLIFILSIVLFSCNNSPKTKKTELNKNLEKKEKVIPNIYVVKLRFYAKDSLPITADLYEVNDKKPTILLCHQAGYSRGEYKETALKLNDLGYSCIAIDQRSGNEVNGVKNETAQIAKERGLLQEYIDAKQDIEAAIDYVYELNGAQPILLVGSSYSASLALLIGTKSAKVKAIAAFSPGEYFKSINIKESIKNSNKSIFVTSSKNEIKAVEELVSAINPKYVTHFKPDFSGVHGSKALWRTTNGNEEYWAAFKEFIQ